MITTPTKATMKGTPKQLVRTGNVLTVWVSSPTGDSSDSHLFEIPCVDDAQAEALMTEWLTVWGLV